MTKNIETHEKGFEFTEKVTVRGRDRYLLNGEIVGLSCTTCKEAFGLDGFNKNKTRVAGKDSTCKGCNAKRLSSWAKNNPEKRKEGNTRWNNSVQKLASTHNLRAKQAGTQAKLKSDHIDILLASAGLKIENGKKMARCQVTGKWTSDFHVCHVQPLNAGGNSENGNLFIATCQVNILQGNTHFFEWIVSDKAKEIVNKEYVEWLLTDLSHRNMKDLKTMLVVEVGHETTDKILRTYFPERSRNTLNIIK
ncbi:hypothetical protein [Peribacillus sp. NPDC097895]|uniref:hypothetical protein n=1 Tax=Peribacillus sp. NPDC097895 TaxID=3390619 RepID=UPI003D040680